MRRIKANNERARSFYLPLVEHVARGMRPADVESLTAGVRLPALDHADLVTKRFWPPIPEPMGSAAVSDEMARAMAAAGAATRATGEAVAAMRASNSGRSTRRLPA